MAEGKRPKDLDPQETRSSALSIPVDHSSFDDAKQILVSELAPLVSELSSQAVGNRATDIIRWNDGAGNEYYTTINDIYKEIGDLSALTGQSPYLRVEYYGTEYKMTTAAFVARVVLEAAFSNAVDARIDARITEVTNQELKMEAEGETFGYLSLRRFDDLVVGTIECENDCSEATVLYTLPAAVQPAKDVLIDIRHTSADPGYLILQANGTVKIMVSHDLDSYANAFGFAYTL